MKELAGCLTAFKLAYALMFTFNRTFNQEFIVLDLEMPVMNGWQLLEVLNTYVGLRHIPVLIVSAHPPRLNQAKHERVVGVVHAPYAMEELTSKIEALLAH